MPLLCLFSFFSQCKDKSGTNLTKHDKSVGYVLGLEPRAAGWKAQTNPLSYGGPSTVLDACIRFVPSILWVLKGIIV